PHADERAPRLLDRALAFLHTVPPRGEADAAGGRPLHERDVVRHDAIFASRVRLNSYLARAGVASRRKADDLIKAGRVTVNGRPGNRNTSAESGPRAGADGHPVSLRQLASRLPHKPAGVVTPASDPQRRPTVVELVPAEPRVVPVGRLDVDTTGAL